ncbi:Outer membrane efflux protein [Blastopirellula retiformator]|uniref:Outer membrane efflux protein n=2 Tax=Blastopirellula retiformator TaxID=2527970 RepID=A0A5C5VM96_9BACT|nr:Outer membrane efflux protein [Blastopirellula retiformator]
MHRQSPAIAPVEMTATANNAAAPNHTESDVYPVSFDSDALTTQAPARLLEAPLEEIQPKPLSMQDVLTAVQSSYPLLTSAYLGRDVALGENVTAWGDFDVKLKGESVSKPENYYKNYHNKLSVEKPLMAGGYLYGGYRVGRGYFPPWYGDEETNDGGEFAAGVGVPLLKGRAIDQRRSELFQAELERRRVEPEIRVQVIEFCRVASIYYWDWVAAGMSRRAQQDLLSLAEQRVQSIQKRIELGDLKQITRITNEQLIASRETKLIEAERKLQSAAIKLSLFFRDPIGEPLLPHDSLLPGDFPPPHLPSVEELDAAPSAAIAASPMLAELEWKARQLRIELDYAENSILPKLDAQLYASKDVGGPANVDRTKSPFELELGLYGEVPLQRRAALGKITSTEAKLQQLNAKRQFTTDKTVATVQDAISALQNAKERIYRAEQNVSLAEEALALARIQFNAGDIDVVELNIFEQSATDAQLTDISSKADFFKAVADYRAALNITP